MTVLRPGQTIGILGGGQLARMLAVAAAELGLRSHIFAPEADSPAFAVAADKTEAAYDDREALTRFAAAVDVVTYEFENVPAATVAILEPLRPVRPGRRALQTTQDRLLEKQFLQGLGIPTAPFLAVADAGSMARAVAQLGRPAILKTRRFGYDGKGQVGIREGSDLGAVFRSLDAPAILEAVVPFSREVSVVAARGLDGTVRAYPLCENVHEHGILATTRVPATVHPATEAAGLAVAAAVAEALEYVGVLAVEMFVVPDRAHAAGERLVANEIAPRVHNSGHWTRGGACTSQFEQHVRAIAGWPLGVTRPLGRIVMRNLIGAAVEAWPQVLAEDGAMLQLYGKGETRPGRKMGHVTTVTPETDPSESPLQ